MIDVGRRSARLVCVIALIALLALSAYSPPWSAPAACAFAGETQCLATGPDGQRSLVVRGDDGRLRGEGFTYIEEHSPTIALGLGVLVLGALALWRPRVRSRDLA